MSKRKHVELEECTDAFFQIFNFTSNPTREEVIQKAKEIAESEGDELQDVKQKAKMFLNHAVHEERGVCHDYISLILRTLKTRLQYITRVPDKVLAQIFNQLPQQDRMSVARLNKQFLKIEYEEALRQWKRGSINEDQFNWLAMSVLLHPQNIDGTIKTKHRGQYEMALRTSIQLEHTRALQQLLTENVHFKDQVHQDALIAMNYAIKRGKCKVLSVLTPKVDVNDRNQDYFAKVIRSGHIKCFDALIAGGWRYYPATILMEIFHRRLMTEHRISRNQVGAMFYFLHFLPKTPSTLAFALRQVARSEFVGAAKRLLEMGAPVELSDGGITPLMEAFWSQAQTRVAMMKLLLENGANPNIENFENENRTLLDAAIAHGLPEVVEILLQWKANPNAAERNEDLSLNIARRLDEGEVKDKIIALLRRYGAKSRLR